MKKLLAHAHEAGFKAISDQLYAFEIQFPLGHPVRTKLFEARCLVGNARSLNREKKDWPQHRYVYQEEEPKPVEENNYPSHHVDCQRKDCMGGLDCTPFREAKLVREREEEE